MCDPATLALSALSGVQSMAQVNAQNKAHAANRANALQAQNDSIDQQGQQYTEQNRSLIQGAFDAELAGRAAESAAYTSAIANGVQGASVRQMMRSKGQVASRNAQRAKQETASLRAQAGNNLRGLSTNTQSRINSVSRTKFGLGDAASMLTPIVRSQMD